MLKNLFRAPGGVSLLLPLDSRKAALKHPDWADPLTWGDPLILDCEDIPAGFRSNHDL